MRIGVLAFATETGLGYQAKSYIKHLPVTKVLELDSSLFHKNLTRQNWYKRSNRVKGFPEDKTLDKFVKDLDIVLFAETPINDKIYEIARANNVKTVNVVNWEFFDNTTKDKKLLPDAIIMPSKWYAEEANKFCKAAGIKVFQLHHPVDREVFQFSLRNSRKHFHLAGRPTTEYDRNGTQDYLSAYPEGAVTIQKDSMAQRLKIQYPNARILTNLEHSELYNSGDILVLPRQYGGNCLPLNEALSCGLPVIMPDVSPNNSFLPGEWLVQLESSELIDLGSKIELNKVSIDSMKQTVSAVASNTVKHSMYANELAANISWEVMRKQYIDVFEDIISN
ncbi:hypothetical protein KA529_02235 [Candidatus Saccharibacteria bacterium]|nr:hypothetical protein [Candidatus Saccharibacteria bacterium]